MPPARSHHQGAGTWVLENWDPPRRPAHQQTRSGTQEEPSDPLWAAACSATRWATGCPIHPVLQFWGSLHCTMEFWVPSMPFALSPALTLSGWSSKPEHGRRHYVWEMLVCPQDPGFEVAGESWKEIQGRGLRAPKPPKIIWGTSEAASPTSSGFRLDSLSARKKISFCLFSLTVDYACTTFQISGVVGGRVVWRSGRSRTNLTKPASVNSNTPQIKRVLIPKPGHKLSSLDTKYE